MRLIVVLLLIGCVACQSNSKSTLSSRAPDKPALCDEYLDLITTYSIYAKSIWHEDPAGAGGYWGDGIGAIQKNGNGAVRGMCNTMFGYAILIHAMDNGWLNADKARRLQSAGLTRDELLRYIRANLTHIIAHHESAPPHPLEPKWGFSWQSTMWLGAAGCTALLVWNDLPDDLRDGIKRVAASEADRIAAKPPKDYKPGDTGAEENGWDSHAPAVALSLDPKNPHADQWWRALKIYVVNVYSTKADQSSDEKIGTDQLRDLITTANLFDDYTLENHGFFHPDYVQASGSELGESWTFLALGDRLNHTTFAKQLQPYATHHVVDVWKKVARPITLSDGQFVFPCGTDWTLNTGIMPNYFAFIATITGDSVAINAERENIAHSMRRRALSPPGKIFGDSAMEWFWEPILVQRCSAALLAHELLDAQHSKLDVERWTLGAGRSFLFPDAKVWVFHNAEYCATASWGKKHMGTFTPDPLRDPYLVFPITDGILPADVSEMIDDKPLGEARVLRMKLKNGACAATVCLPQSVVWISAAPLRGIGIENDRMSGAKRELASETAKQSVIGLQPREPFTISGSWLNIDARIGFVASGKGFQYAPAGKYNTRSVAIDRVTPVDARVWQMIPHATVDQTKSAVAGFSAEVNARAFDVMVADRDGTRYHIRLPMDSSAAAIVERSN